MADRTIEIRIIGKNEASGVLSDVGVSIQNVGKMAAGIAVGGVVALGGGLVAAATSGLQMNDAMEKATARINAFTKDGGKTAEILEMIRDRAAKTPFAFQEMTNATAALLPTAKQAGVGLDELLEKAEILAASNPAEGLEGAAFALKEAVSGDFTSIIERFNLPRSYINQLKEEGVPALEAVQMAMQEMGLDTDLVAALAETAGGRWSTFQDTLQGLAATVTQPIFDTFSKGLGDVNSLIDANIPVIQAMAESVSTAIEGIINSVGMLITSFKSGGFQAAFKVFDDGSSRISSLLEAFGMGEDAAFEWGETISNIAMVIGTFVTDHLEELKGALIGIGAVLGGAVIVTAITAIAGVLATIVSPIGLIIAGAALLGAAWAGNWYGIRDTLTAVWEGTIKPALFAIYNWLTINIPIAIQTLSNFWTGTLLPIFEMLWDFWTTTALPALTDLYKWLSVNIPVAIEELSNFWTETLLPIFQMLWDFWTGTALPALTDLYNWLSVNIPVAIQTVVDFFNNTLVPTFTTVFNTISTIVFSVLGAIAQWWKEHGESVLTIVNFIWERIQLNFNNAVTIIGAIIYAVLLAIQGFWATWGDAIIASTLVVWEFIKAYISTAMAIVGAVIDMIAAIIQGDWTAFSKALQDLWKAVWDIHIIIISAARDLLFIAIDAIVDYITGQWQTFTGYLSSAWTALWDHVVNWFNVRKAFVETSIAIWTAVIQFMWAEFKTNLSNAWTALWDGIVNWFSTKRTQIEAGITGLITTVQNAWQSFRDNLSNWWGTAWDGIVNKINEKKAEITSSITRLISDIKNMFTADAFKQMGERIIEGIRRGIQEGWDVVTSLAAQLGQALIDAVKASLGLGTASADMASDLLNAQSNAVLAAGTVSSSSAQINNSVTNNYYFTQTINGNVPSAREEFELMKSNALAFG